MPSINLSNSILCNIGTPSELLYAFGFDVMPIEYLSCLSKTKRETIEWCEQEGISTSFCTYHKVGLGELLKEEIQKPYAIVNVSTPCDASQLSFKTLSHSLSIPQFFIEVPLSREEESILYVYDQLLELKKALRQYRTFHEDVFLHHIENSKQTISIMKHIQELRKEKYIPQNMRMWMEEGLRLHSYLGTDSTLEYALELEKKYQDGKTYAKDIVKLLWMHTSPYWSSTLEEVFQQYPVRVVIQEFGYDSYLLEKIYEDPYMFMASRIVNSIYNVSSQERVEEAYKMKERLGLDGIVLFSQWGCKKTYALQKELKEDSLVLHGDGVYNEGTSSEQLRTRLEAFIEMLKENKS